VWQFIRTVVPAPIRSALRSGYRRLLFDGRARAVASLPKVPLRELHVRNCRIVLDRREMLRQLGHQAIVAELGVDRGEFSNQLLELVNPRVLHLVDTWNSTRYHSGLMRSVEERFAPQTAAGQVVVHRALSTDACERFEDGALDLVYIDTDHSYRGTHRELRAYAPKMRCGGVIAGHDYCVGDWAGDYRYGVIEAVHEFCVEEGWELIFITAEPLEHQSFAIRKLRTAESHASDATADGLARTSPMPVHGRRSGTNNK
jgi:hypothetical protein